MTADEVIAPLRASRAGAVLVTGGAGVIGAYVVRELLAGGEWPVVLDADPGARFLDEFGAHAEIYRGDINDLDRLTEICRRHEVTVILHLAALTGAAPDDKPMVLFRANMLGTMQLLEAARLCDVSRVVMASTRTVYPDFEGTEHGYPLCRPVPEDHWLDPRRPYEVWKHAAERIGEFYHRKFGVEFAAFRFATYYAAERTVNPGGRAMGLLHGMISNAARGVPTRILSGGERVMDCVYVKDVARAFALATRARQLPHSVYNVGSGAPDTPRRFAEAVRHVLPDALVEVGPGIDFAPGHYCVLDISRAARDFGYSPAWSLETGIADCIARLRLLAETVPARAT